MRKGPYGWRRRTRFAIAMLAALVIAATALAGCSSGGTTDRGNGPTAATSTPLPTADPAEAAAICGANWAPSGVVVRAGDVLIGPVHLAELATPASKLPDDTPLRPLRIQFGSSTAGLAVSADLPTNPTMDEHVGGYEIDICNASATQAHTLTGVSARIDAFTPYSGNLNQWNPCSGAYSRAGSSSGCAGAYFAAEYVHVAFESSAGAGSVEMARQVASGRDDGAGQPYADVGPLPLPLPPRKAFPVNVGMTIPNSPGTFTFAFGVALDGRPPAFAPAPKPILFAEVAHNWTGRACLRNEMQAQIPPATDPPAYYICPQG
jgi:hypothetical protein